MIASIVRFFVARSRTTLGLWAVLLVIGVAAYTTFLPRDGFPSVDIPLAVVSGPYFVDDIERVDGDVLDPSSGANNGGFHTHGQDRTRIDAILDKISKEGLQSLTPEEQDILREALDDATLPPDVVPEFTELNAAKFLNEYDLLVAVYGPDGTSAEELDALAADVAVSLADLGFRGR